jgi:hypothetical protein
MKLSSAKFQIQKKERETNQALIRRFTRRLKDSGIITEAKRSQFRRKEKSAVMRKRAVLRKLEKQKEYVKLQKLGKV